MARTLNLPAIFAADAEELERARDTAQVLHPTDVKAAGNQVEHAVREYLKRMLQPRYHVTSGHLIDSEHRVSRQLDVIIADNSSLPTLFTAKDGTEYVPVTSAYAIGEVKSTYYHSKHYFGSVSDSMRDISQMNRELVKNTMHGGLNDESTVPDMLRSSSNRYLNNLFCFLFCVDAGDFEFRKVRDLLRTTDPKLLPSMTILLNKGVVLYGDRRLSGSKFSKYPNEATAEHHDWFYAEIAGPSEGTSQGAHLGLLYAALIDHLSNSYLDPPNAYPYTRKMQVFRRSSVEWAKDDE